MSDDTKQKLRDYIDQLIEIINGDEQLELFKRALVGDFDPPSEPHRKATAEEVSQINDMLASREHAFDNRFAINYDDNRSLFKIAILANMEPVANADEVSHGG